MGPKTAYNSLTYSSGPCRRQTQKPRKSRQIPLFPGSRVIQVRRLSRPVQSAALPPLPMLRKNRAWSPKTSEVFRDFGSLGTAGGWFSGYCMPRFGARESSSAWRLGVYHRAMRRSLCASFCAKWPPQTCNETTQPGIDTKDPRKPQRLRSRSRCFTLVHRHGLGRKRLT